MAISTYEMRAAFTANCQPEKAAAGATVSFKALDLNLHTSIAGNVAVGGPSWNDFSVAIEKPGRFTIDFHVPKKDYQFKFSQSLKLAKKPLNLSYTHTKSDGRTILDGTLVIDPANKVSVNHVPEAGNVMVKYTYVHGRSTTIEPSYDFGKNSWGLAVSRKLYGGDMLRATYETSSKTLGAEWSMSLKSNGSIKVSASVNLADEHKMPKLYAETTWDFEMRAPCVFAHRRQWFQSGREAYGWKNTRLPIY